MGSPLASSYAPVGALQVLRQESTVSDQFSLTRSKCARSSDPELRQEIDSHTGDDDATSGIMRSIGRFGDDSSILRYDVSRQTASRSYRHGKAAAWSVRAVRA